MFATMWVKDVIQVIQGNNNLSYETAPTLFWVIRYFDLGFTIPLGYISLYFLWTRAEETYEMQMLFYGFFLTMISTVNAMAIIMLINKDPQFSAGAMGMFGFLFFIVIIRPLHNI